MSISEREYEEWIAELEDTLRAIWREATFHQAPTHEDALHVIAELAANALPERPTQ